MDDRLWINLTMIEQSENGDIHRPLIVKKSWIVGLVDLGKSNSPPTALLLGNHGLPMVSVNESIHSIMDKLES